MQTGKAIVTYAKHTEAVERVAWSPDGKRIASGGDDNIVRVWDASIGQTLLQYRGHNDIVFKVAWSPDETMITSAPEQLPGVFYIYDLTIQ